MRVKENECKEKRIYDWYASQENNIDAAWGVAGEPWHGDVHHHTRPQHSINGARHSPGLSCRRAPPPRDRQRHLLPWLAGAVLRVPLHPHPIDVLRAQTIFLKEDDHRRDGKVASSRMKFRKLSGGIEDEGYKGNTQTLWKVLLSRREFQFLTF